MYNKKGQVAMEFLMTYGWAILAAMVIIGLLGYYYFSSDMLSPSGGSVSHPFNLYAYSVSESDAVIELRNDGGETYNVTGIEIGDLCEDDYDDEIITAGDTKSIDVACDHSLEAGETYNERVIITYRRSGSSVDLTSTGSIRGTVVA